MEVQAHAKYIKVQPRKVRLIAAEVRGMPATKASTRLQFHPSKGAFTLRKVLDSAIANAVENNKISPENLRIARIQIDEGPRMKRITQRAQGRGNRIIKKTSHILVVVEDYVPAAQGKPHGTKAKSRPKFEAPKPKKKTRVTAATPAEEVVATAAEEATETNAPAESAEGAEPVEAEAQVQEVAAFSDEPTAEEVEAVAESSDAADAAATEAEHAAEDLATEQVTEEESTATEPTATEEEQNKD